MINLMKTTIFAIFFCAPLRPRSGKPLLSRATTRSPFICPMIARNTHAARHGAGIKSPQRLRLQLRSGRTPMSDFVTLKRETPLGDIARAYRKEHAMAPKAVLVLEK